MSFQNIFSCYNKKEISEEITRVTPAQVEAALDRGGRGKLSDFMALVSPAAAFYLEEMATLSRDLTRKRFGNTVQLFLPVYLSNHCKNICTYCGFSVNNSTPRLALNRKEALQEIKAVKALDVDHVLLLTGEDNLNTGVDYLYDMIILFKEHFSHVAIEVQPLKEKEYVQLREVGLDAVFLYQETYDIEAYAYYHPRGKKANFFNRVATQEGLGDSEIHKMGLGVLLGLADWRADSFFCALHLQYLKKAYWRTRFSISFPRLRPASGVNKQIDFKAVSERDLAQLIFAYRIWDEDLELSLSTREREEFRNHIIPLGITSISAGSKTNPGGYACYPEESLEQFAISDERSPNEICRYLEGIGLEPIKKDWAKEFSPNTSSVYSLEK